jgi:hypothetical protein
MSLNVIISRLIAMFVALSLLFGPLAMDRAMAAAPAAGHQMGDASKSMAGHCEPRKQDKPHKALAKPCCAAMCATAAVLPHASSSEQLFERLLATPAPPAFRRGILSEIATPPPRFA